MKEQSHKDEMSAAIRGDFERLRERGVSATLAPVEPPDEPEPVDEPCDTEPGEHADEAVQPDRPGLFGRLFGR